MPDLLPFDHRRDAKAEFHGGLRASIEAIKNGGEGPKTHEPTNAYLVTVEIVETHQVTYLVPAFSPEEAERLVARKPNEFEQVQDSPIGIEAASVVNIEPVTSSRV